MTPETLSSIVGIVVSLAFLYIPPLAAWYNDQSKSGKYRGLFMLGAMVLVAAVIFGLGCANIVVYVACTQAGAIVLFKIFVAALVANQGTYLTLRKTTDPQPTA